MDTVRALSWSYSHAYTRYQHVAVAHAPTVKCTPCGREFKTVADRKQHYQASSNHPTCFVCREGFADDGEIDNVSV